ncbi:hypothetical protein [Xanthobacter agilis]|uniref:MxaK protein n=1 Tax=Xanthobacter agilis TaxID=47492 RepID=A0ABU0LAB9_XANAG|nr:hypothetical protein [Xanthobacter agilis]MDQ0504076.1 mxaK protein [Xanthobacter agilis]
MTLPPSVSLDPARRRWLGRRILRLALALVTLGALAALMVESLRIGAHMRDNATIAALAGGRDAPVTADAPARVLLARAHFLMVRDRLDEAQPLVDLLARKGDADIAVAGLYDMGNARLARAIDHLERSQIDPAVPEVRLAKAAYRAALTREPGFWNAKYNLDVAQRLVRDFPEIDRDPKDDPKQAPKRVWTDLPGLPKGLP